MTDHIGWIGFSLPRRDCCARFDPVAGADADVSIKPFVRRKPARLGLITLL